MACFICRVVERLMRAPVSLMMRFSCARHMRTNGKKSLRSAPLGNASET